MELRIGGRVELHFLHAELSAEKTVPEKFREMCGSGHSMHGRVTRCEPPRLLSYTWSEGAGEASEVTFELTPQGKQVRLLLTHRRLGDDPATLSGVAGGWHTHTAVLAAQLNGLTPPPFWSTYTMVEADYVKMLANKTRSA